MGWIVGSRWNCWLSHVIPRIIGAFSHSQQLPSTATTWPRCGPWRCARSRRTSRSWRSEPPGADKNKSKTEWESEISWGCFWLIGLCVRIYLHTHPHTHMYVSIYIYHIHWLERGPTELIVAHQWSRHYIVFFDSFIEARGHLRDLLLSRKVNETARKVGQKMGLPAGWDVVERMAGTDAARLLKKEGRRCRVTMQMIEATHI